MHNRNIITSVRRREKGEERRTVHLKVLIKERNEACCFFGIAQPFDNLEEVDMYAS